MSDSSRPHGLQPTRLFGPWDFPGKNTGVGCHCLLQTKCRVPGNYHYAFEAIGSHAGWSTSLAESPCSSRSFTQVLPNQAPASQTNSTTPPENKITVTLSPSPPPSRWPEISNLSAKEKTFHKPTSKIYFKSFLLEAFLVLPYLLAYLPPLLGCRPLRPCQASPAQFSHFNINGYIREEHNLNPSLILKGKNRTSKHTARLINLSKCNLLV